GHHAGLYTNPNDPLKGKGLSVDESVKYYLSKGAPSEKVVIGAAYYSRGWEKVSSDKVDQNNPGLFGKASPVNKDSDLSPSSGAKPEATMIMGAGGRNTGTWSYGSFDKLKVAYPGMKEYWDDTAKAPYMYNETTGSFFTYDNVKSIQEKVKYVKENNLGGMIAWMASNDKATNVGSLVRDELTKATKEALYGQTPLVKYNVSRERLDVSAKVSITPAQYGNGSIINIVVTNNEKMISQGETLTTVERAAKSMKNTKVYIEMADGIKIINAQYPTPVVKEENGYYVCDLGGLSDGKIWAPGSSRTYSLTTDKALTSTSQIVNVSFTQRMYLNSAEFGKQSLWGSSTEDEIKDENGNYLPTISGVRNKVITVKDSFDPLAGISARDREDGDLTSKIVVTGTVNNKVAGKYTLTYTVKDSTGAKREATITITVKNKVIIEADNFDPTKAYNKGDLVVYKGIRYEYQYFGVSPNTPGTHEGIWKTIGPAEIEVIEPDTIDLDTIAAKYNTKKGEANWDVTCDVNNDNIVDLYDLVTVASKIK
ncbi:MAG: glycosyl hydrolase family 18 protein, partial [Clostridium sp.]